MSSHGFSLCPKSKLYSMSSNDQWFTCFCEEKCIRALETLLEFFVFTFTRQKSEIYTMKIFKLYYYQQQKIFKEDGLSIFRICLYKLFHTQWGKALFERLCQWEWQNSHRKTYRSLQHKSILFNILHKSMVTFLDLDNDHILPLRVNVAVFTPMVWP